MAILNFTLSPEALAKLHDALICLGKFSDAVAIEATSDKLILSALNSSKSAYAAFTLDGNKFFSKYQYRPVTSGNQIKEKFTCKIYNKALLSVFKGGRIVDSSRERDAAVEKCEVSIEDDDGKAKSRFIIKNTCRHGVLKTYRLTFEESPPMHARFTKDAAHNCWSISSRALREYTEHFGPGTEQLDIYSEDGRVSLTSYTEKIMSGNEVLKQPLHTTIAIDTLEFGQFSVEEKLHIVISVKDFKSIVTHASITNTMVKAHYSQPSSPMQLTYGDDGINAEFILMTIGESRGASATPAPAASRANSKRPASRQPLEAASSSKRITTTEMPPPPLIAAPSISREILGRKDSRPSPPPPQPSVHSQSLFLEPEDDDQRWEPHEYDEDEGEMVSWDDGGQSHRTSITVNSGKSQNVEVQHPTAHRAGMGDGFESEESRTIPTQRLAPTQRVSEIKGIFD